jgi:uncharacterized protein with HEPN domain
MSPSLPDFLRHISDECNYLIQLQKGKTRDQLLEDETYKRAIARSLEVIGEAVKKLDEDFRSKYPQIEWKKIARTRDVMIHHYFGIDYDIVWEIMTERIEPLRDYVLEIIAGLGRTGDVDK